ncbi:hypothetical protein DTO013E5_8821 [Penicillium roqueforti]|uniref:Genomic scaffold, ProqFM164S01 n=1 Tax=Penicillium roqueforti (strain FM164) TaxID=1365484 RepID=W6PVJ5_PENRF|nr:uncharacterized protein LCP9604111_7099 [Penicillium roqueforti]CDM27786.1 unnamed protein product [Penicillium roqueforti FM164]KAF9244707.1 hypothetical protein LCP9604111_7099 [Penicillium roqueforti]KAI1831273.1 hypothetical protein CBS147337_8031 [Penicillium roqueforti]KAI2681017.1 hypothetical protein LCP963914a_6968 [Penicillium roqueforti]KAI2689573.1 hypothetical protein CBS147355_24 [Penicillium roqueforti]
MDTLSSRSYLELSQEQETPTNTRSSRLRPRTKAAQPPKIPDQATDKISAGPDRPVRKRGRPRSQAKDATAIEERRLQIRRAQRTYRLKKETTIQTLRSRVNALEQTLENVSNLLGGAHHEAVDRLNEEPTLQPSVDYLARTRELILAEINKTRQTSENDNDLQLQQTNAPSRDKAIFGYELSYTRPQKSPGTPSSYPAYNRARSPSPLINRILPTATIYTYSHQESNLSRRLHRFSLEHTYRWLTDPRTEPALLSRVFGLVPCIHDMAGIRRHYRRTVQSEIGSVLEFAKMPFYTLGGAGKHFPRRDGDGNPVDPENSRRPGKILRRMVRILQRGGIQDWDEDWSGEREPVAVALEGGVVQMSEEERIRSLDLDGEWFDCHDVQGYLEHRGVVLDGSALRLSVPESLVGALYGFSPDRSTVSSLYASPGISPGNMESVSSTSSSYTLDIECFFDLLLANLRILGRAPGFRVSDVDAALRSAVSRRPFT